ncbi:lysine--tRNA ligase [Candidatus Riesia pediculicola]|nr:lysine--tRNA ligase [Candidatus Riesia pediculicola]
MKMKTLRNEMKTRKESFFQNDCEDFKRDHLSEDLYKKFYEKESKELKKLENYVSVSGRMISKRIFGKASFFTLQDMSGKIQVYVSSNHIKEEIYEKKFKKCNLGDLIGVHGKVFKTKTGELTVDCRKIFLLTRSYRTISSKFYGLKNKEIQHRNRCLDLILNQRSRNTFIIRSKIISWLRCFMNEKGFMEVETPIMQPMYGGASAKPFMTRHNALKSELYLRIAPELYLKRLVIGGFEKIFEIGKNFRNEGVSTIHNPEFTMMEFYEAYKNYLDLMDFIENLFHEIVESTLKKSGIKYGENFLNFDKRFKKVTMKQSILQNISNQFSMKDLENKDKVFTIARSYGVQVEKEDSIGEIQYKIFEKVVEKKLIQPTFVTEYPIDVSPLSKRSRENPLVAERFELFIGGYEIANGFSELNDPVDQTSRFLQQSRKNGIRRDIDEDTFYDKDYITSLEYGLPPTAGVGIGIDRLVMLLTNRRSIRDVIFFPALRKK